MSYLTIGPRVSLPGSLHKVPLGGTCSVHTDIAAVIRVQGETDSLGTEYRDLCHSCYAGFKLTATGLPPEPEACEWCLAFVTNLQSTRDYDEGNSGPIYRVCKECRHKQAQETANDT